VNAPEVIDPACTGKMRYLNKGAALAVIGRRKGAKRIRRANGLNAYRCKRCGHWHIGSSAP
jgi:hypothetical protein